MSNDLRKKAIEMILKGATLLSEPCPYCKGVRVMKDGNALCVNCGREGLEKDVPTQENQDRPLVKFEKKLKSLYEELDIEKDHQKQQEIMKSISDLLTLMEKLKK